MAPERRKRPRRHLTSSAPEVSPPRPTNDATSPLLPLLQPAHCTKSNPSTKRLVLEVYCGVGASAAEALVRKLPVPPLCSSTGALTLGGYSATQGYCWRGVSACLLGLR